MHARSHHESKTEKNNQSIYSAFGNQLVLLLRVSEDNLPVLGQLGEFLTGPLDFHFQVFYRPRRRGRRVDCLFGRLSELFVLGWGGLFLGGLRRTEGQSSRGACDLVDLLGGEDFVDSRAAGLE